MIRVFLGWCCGAALAAVCLAAEHRGVVKFGGLPLPGVSVTVTQQSGFRMNAITGLDGTYSVEVAAPFTVELEMQLFAAQRSEFTVATPAAEWNFELLPITAVRATPAAFQRSEVKVAAQPARAETPDPAAAAELVQRAADGLLVNGSVSNATSSPFAQLPAFGNNRRGQKSLYNGSLGLILNNALFDARAFSLTGQNTPKPPYNRAQGLFSFGGPMRFPWFLKRNGPNFTVSYQWTRNSNAATQTGLMPTALERTGEFGRPVTDPLNGAPFAGNRIPASRIHPAARVLLGLYPTPNFAGNSRYNFQVPLVSGLHQDDLQARANKQVRRHGFSGNFAWQSTRSSTPDLFGFLDTGRVRGFNAGASYRRFFTSRTFLNTGTTYSSLATQATPFFANRRNVSAEAGIGGNNQEASNWGSPNLVFLNGISPLLQAQFARLRNQTVGVSADLFFNRGGHNVQTGVNLRRQQFNVLSQQDARGTFSFNGATTGNDFASFLLGTPDTSAIAFGNADKYLRGRISEAFINDDWRVNPSFTMNVGLRWEYWSPLSEKYGRLVNLDLGPGITSATPRYLLPQPDRNNLAPRLAFSWRPAGAVSTIVRGGYGVYYDTSIYQPIAMEMAQQAPLSKSLRVANTPLTPLTLANGFSSSGATSATTYAVDPRFRVGYLQTWQLSLQRDLPFALQVTATYNGGKGTRSQQQSLPNTFPGRSLAPSGFTYLTSNGNSSRHAGQFQLRRRMRSGMTAQVQYTWAKALDNALLGGRGRPMIAQDWLNLQAERGRSNFDQRHLVAASWQYTSGMGLRGGALAKGWAARLWKEWTLGSQVTWGTGLPLTPIYVGAVAGTGVTGNLRPQYTGAPLYAAPPGFSLNPQAYAPPAAGTWGNASRNSITGPPQFVVNSFLGRTFRSAERISMDLRLDAANSTNTPTFPSWNTVAGHAQFGLPNATNPMRSVQVTLRARF
ncbi:MAG: TonB-dependent receptor [Bryobacteraceae bacterium]|nr:TonB-dependent receptor [Bryobacteraceae bacterium]